MKKIGKILSSVLMILIGAAAIGAYFMLKHNGQDMDRYAIAFVLGIGFFVSGILELFGRKKQG